MLSGFACVPSPAPGPLGFGARGGRSQAGAPEFAAFPRAGSVSSPRRRLRLRGALPLGPRARGGVPRLRSRSA